MYGTTNVWNYGFQYNINNSYTNIAINATYCLASDWQVMKSNNFTGTLQDYITYLRNDPDNYYATSDEMLQGYKDIVTDSHNIMASIIGKVPEAKVE